jgi:DNA-binding transcriptional MerR regulator
VNKSPATASASPPGVPGSAEGRAFLKMAELAEQSDVPVATIRHYLREGLLPEPVKTSKNMAYYPPEFVGRIRLIKQLQEQRFMPLKVIRELLESGNGNPERLRDLVELEDRILERAAAGERERVPVEEIAARYEVPQEVLSRLAELGVLTPTDDGYSPSDIQIVEAMSRFRAGGYDESIGFTVYDTLRYKQAVETLAEEEVRLITKRLTGMEPDKVFELIAAGAEPLNDLLSALRTKALLAELERLRESRRAG